LSASFEKNIYTPQEDAKVKVVVNNKDCKVDCKRVEFFVEQTMKLKISHHDWHLKHTLLKVHEKGPHKGEDWKKDMELDLAKIKTEHKLTKKKKGHVKEVSAEDLW